MNWNLTSNKEGGLVGQKRGRLPIPSQSIPVLAKLQ